MRYFCTFENRRSAFIGAKLLALSLERHCQDFTLFLAVIDEEPDLAAWIGRQAPHVTLVRLPPFAKGTSLKHVKAVLILNLFERGITDITWLDTDLLVLRDLEPLLAPLSHETLLVSQEETGYAFQHNATLLAHYGLKPGRALDYYVNTCVIRVTTHHRELIQRYLDSLLDPVFLEQQTKSEREKVADFAFEQNIMEALLSAKGGAWAPEFPVLFILKGPGIIQELGVTTYRLRNRLRNGLGLRRPWFVHVPRGGQALEQGRTFAARARSLGLLGLRRGLPRQGGRGHVVGEFARNLEPDRAPALVRPAALGRLGALRGGKNLAAGAHRHDRAGSSPHGDLRGHAAGRNGRAALVIFADLDLLGKIPLSAFSSARFPAWMER